MRMRSSDGSRKIDIKMAMIEDGLTERTEIFAPIPDSVCREKVFWWVT